jgi:peroxiredoxin
MKKTISAIIVAIILMATPSLAQSEFFYKKVKLRAYSKDAPKILSEEKINITNYAQLETGMEKHVTCYIGMYLERIMKYGWIRIMYDFSTENSTIKSHNEHLFSITSKLKNHSSNFTLSYVESTSTWRKIAYFNSSDDMAQVALELICDTTTNELQYSWLNGKGECCDTITFYSIDKLYSYGNKFPNLKLELLNGNTISTKDLLGKTVVINWWSTTCSPCIAEIPGLNTLVDTYKNNPNIVFLAIAHSTKDRVERFLNKYEFNYQQALFSKEAITLFEARYPRHLIVDSLGIIRFSQSGGYAEIYKQIDREIRRTLGEAIILAPKRSPKGN